MSKIGEVMEDSRTAKMMDAYNSSSSKASPMPNAAMMNENSPLHVMATLVMMTSRVKGLNG